MPILFLHGGAPKTGTSYLQVLFAQNYEVMEERGVLYPKGHLFEQARKGQITSGNGVELANYIRPHLPHKIEDLDSYPERFEDMLIQAGSSDILLSSEFLQCPLNERMEKILDIVKRNNFTIKYVFFVRDIGEAAFSTYSQQVKRHGEANSFKEFIKTWDPLYRNSIETAIKAFGEDCVSVFNFDEHRANLASFFFETLLGIDFSPEVKKVVNRSLSPQEAEMVRLINEYTHSNSKVSTYVSDALMNIDAPRVDLKLTQAEVNLLEKRFRTAVDFVNTCLSGRPTVICNDIVKSKKAIVNTDFEKAMVAILSKVVQKITV